MNQNIACPCGKNTVIEFEEEPDLDVNPEIIDKICNGTFMSYTCSACGKKHKPEYQIMIIWKSKKLRLEVLPELERWEFYRRKKAPVTFETIIGFPEMADRITVMKDNLNPLAIEALKYYLLVKAEENYPNKEINVWYHSQEETGIEFHLEGIRAGEVAVMKVPIEVYDKTCEDLRKNPKKEIYTSLRFRSYLSVQNIFRPNVLSHDD